MPCRPACSFCRAFCLLWRASLNGYGAAWLLWNSAIRSAIVACVHLLRDGGLAKTLRAACCRMPIGTTWARSPPKNPTSAGRAVSRALRVTGGVFCCCAYRYFLYAHASRRAPLCGEAGRKASLSPVYAGFHKRLPCRTARRNMLRHGVDAIYYYCSHGSSRLSAGGRRRNGRKEIACAGRRTCGFAGG